MPENDISFVSIPLMDRPPPLTDGAISDMQLFLNDFFRLDLPAPIYLVRAAEPRPGILAELEGGVGAIREKQRISKWNGPGFLFRIHDDRLTPTQFHSVSAHEAAHCFDPHMMPPTDCWNESIDRDIQEIYADQLKSAGFPPDAVGQQVCYHDARFWRNTFHIAHRMSQSGKQCRSIYLGAPEESIYQMAAVIEPELEAMSNVPFWRLARRPVSGAFSQLFQRVRTDVFPTQFLPLS